VIVIGFAGDLDDINATDGSEDYGNYYFYVSSKTTLNVEKNNLKPDDFSDDVIITIL
jgi:hypothetical protein